MRLICVLTHLLLSPDLQMMMMLLLPERRETAEKRSARIPETN
jgi:hypothetical protein